MFARWLRIGFAAVSLTALPAFAYAEPSTGHATQKEHVREGKEEKGEKAEFPMPAAQYRARIEARIAKTRERIVDHLQIKKVAADKQQAVLAKFDEGSTVIMAEVDKVTADGTVTREEAKQVNEVARTVRGHHAKGHKEGRGKEARRDRDEKNKKDS